MKTKVYVYEITWSAVETVEVGSLIVAPADHQEDHGERRGWTLFNAATGNFEDGWAGVRLDRACLTCFRVHRKVRPHKHEGDHGDGPYLVPTRLAKEAAL